MLGILASVFSVLKTIPAKVLGKIGLAAFVLFLMYNWGKSDCQATYERSASKANRERAESELLAMHDAYESGLMAARKEAENKDRVAEITRNAGMEAGADDVCLSEETLDRIRALQ